MAVIFVSPKKRQRIVFWSAAALFLLALGGISLLMVLPEIKNQLTVIPAEGVYVMPDIKINFGVVDSAQVQGLNSFSDIPLEFTYTAMDQNNSLTSGVVTASSQTEARASLAAEGLTVITLQPAGVGRTDPFSSY